MSRKVPILVVSWAAIESHRSSDVPTGRLVPYMFNLEHRCRHPIRYDFDDVASYCRERAHALLHAHPHTTPKPKHTNQATCMHTHTHTHARTHTSHTQSVENKQAVGALDVRTKAAIDVRVQSTIDVHAQPAVVLRR